MFFFGIFGISNKEKELRDINNVVCKKCRTMTTYKLIKVYNFFHIFFIPIIRWGQRYYLKSRCCNTIFEINPDLGGRLEQGEDVYIEDKDMTEVYSDYERKFYNEEVVCLACKNKVNTSFTYCPHCGERLK